MVLVSWSVGSSVPGYDASVVSVGSLAFVASKGCVGSLASVTVTEAAEAGAAETGRSGVTP